MGNKTSGSKLSCKVCSKNNDKDLMFTSYVMEYNLPNVCKTLPNSQEGEKGECSIGYRNKEGTMECEDSTDCEPNCIAGVRWIKEQNKAKGSIKQVMQVVANEGERVCKERTSAKKCDNVLVSVFDPKSRATATGLYTCSI